MLWWLILCLAAGCLVDVLNGLYTRACAHERPVLMSVVGAFIGFLRLTVIAGIVNQGLEKGLIYIICYAIGNVFGGLLSFKINIQKSLK